MCCAPQPDARNLLTKRCKVQRLPGTTVVGESRLIAVELAARSAPAATAKQSSVLTLRLSNGRKVEVDFGFDAEALARLVSVLEKL
jgi:hypothetical protein